MAPRAPLLIAAALGAVAVAAVLGAAALGQPKTGQPEPAAQVANPTDAPPSLIERGKYLTEAGDCVACHTTAGGARFAGGRALQTPFGTLLSANITPDPTGIGSWTSDQFYRALHSGIDDDGQHLYPAFPYNYYTKVTRADSDAIYAYLRTIPPVHYHPVRNQLPIPFNIRLVVAVWNWLFLHEGEFRPNPTKSAEWNRGAYLVEGLGHCGACHTPMNLMGAPQTHRFLNGGSFGDWFAPDITPNRRKGLGGWSRADLIEFLKTGRNGHASASAEMGEVVTFSTSLMTDADLNAIATYLGAQQPSRPLRSAEVTQAVMRQGQAIYMDECSACHRMNGEGVPRFFPPLQGDANLQQADPTTTLHFILTGVQSTPTQARPTGLAMPAYAWKLNDGQIAAVETYIRNAWGNDAPAVEARQVAKLRRRLVVRASQFAPIEHAGGLDHPTPETLAPAYTDSRDNGAANAGRIVGSGPGGGGGSGTNSGGGQSTGGPG